MQKCKKSLLKSKRQGHKKNSKPRPKTYYPRPRTQRASVLQKKGFLRKKNSRIFREISSVLQKKKKERSSQNFREVSGVLQDEVKKKVQTMAHF